MFLRSNFNLCDMGRTIDDAVLIYIFLLYNWDHFFNISQNNLALDALNQFPFYLLLCMKQKMFVLLLNRMQNGKQLQLGPFLELNYSTATNVSLHTLNSFTASNIKIFISFNFNDILFSVYKNDLYVCNDDATSNKLNNFNYSY